MNIYVFEYNENDYYHLVLKDGDGWSREIEKIEKYH